MIAGSAEPSSPPGNSSDRNVVPRALAVIEGLVRADAHGVGVRELATATGISRSAIHRLLSQLVDMGYAATLPGDRYEAGPRALAWVALLGSEYGIVDAARDAIDAVVAQYDESAYVVQYDAEAKCVTFSGAAHSSKPVRYILELGSKAPLHAGAAGKAVLAFLPDDLVDTLDLQRHTETTIVSREVLAVDLAETRARGYALSMGERIADAVGIAAPVFADEDVAGAITLTIPSYRFKAALRDAYAEAVIAAADATSSLMSTRAPRRARSTNSS